MQKQSFSILDFVLLFFLGALLAAAAELPYGGWIQIPILSLAWWQLCKEKIIALKIQALSGFIFGLGYFVVGIWWLYISMHDVGGIHAIPSILAVFLLSSYLAIYFSIASLAIPLFKKSRASGLFLAASWVVMDYLRGYLFTGFPWMGFAETQINGPFAGIAPIFGSLGCTFLVVWSSWELLQLKRRWLIRSIALIGIVTLSQSLGLISFTKPFSEPISVRLIQGNFSQSLKFNPLAIGQQIDFYTKEITKSPANLIVTPETAFPWPQANLPVGLIQYLKQFSNNNESNVLLGVIGEVNNDRNLQYTNRALGLIPNQAPYQYDKAHLVPFGEFIPIGFRWFVDAFRVPMSDFARGTADQAPLRIVRQDQPDIRAAITICYEDVFGGELASRIRESEQPVNLLINMTNLAWFGQSQAPTQQLRLSQLRSLETGLPALRATNTGITSIVDTHGAVLQSLPEFTQATLNSKVQTYSGKTPYVIWGNSPIMSFSCLLILWGLVRLRRY